MTMAEQSMLERLARIVDAGAFMPIANESNLDAYALGVAQRWKEKEQSKAFELADHIIAELGLAWRLIESAPRDGTWVILREENGAVCTARWKLQAGFVRQDRWQKINNTVCLLRVTHWMPLLPASEVERG